VGRGLFEVGKGRGEGLSALSSVERASDRVRLVNREAGRGGSGSAMLLGGGSSRLGVKRGSKEFLFF